MELIKKCLAECIGTFVLVLFGCGTACAVGCDTLPGYMLTALAFGLVIVAMAYSIGNISGCHINPAVSIAVFVSKKMTFTEFLAYIASQFIGGVAGGAMLLAVFGENIDKNHLGSNGLYNNNIWASLIIEIILTFVFVIAILGVTSKKSNGSVAGIVIGLSLTLVHIFGIYFTGTSVNPARSFGPAIFAGGDSFTNVWVFIVAPLVGAVLAALIYNFMAKGVCDTEEEEAAEAAAPVKNTPRARKSGGKKKRK